MWFVFAALAMVWWMAIRLLWNDWEIDPQYSYGFLVPLLCLALFAMRWKDRPDQSPASDAKALRVAVIPLVILAAIQPFFEANPEWRVLGMTGAFCALAITLLGLQAAGGRGWVRHFAFPVLFFLIAVPWPRNFEEGLMGWLMQHNAIASLEVLHWCGFEAVRRGNLIALPTGTIGVEEACSGVRSLQSGIMAALFFGEIFRFRIFTRSLLLFVSMAVAVAGNFVRSTALAIIASKKGLHALEQWHDVAGYAVLGITIGSLWLLASWRNKKILAHAPPFEEVEQAPMHWPSRLIPASLGAAILGVGSLLGTELWFRAHELNLDQRVKWAMHPGTPGTKPVTINDRTRRMLFFPEGFSERFIDRYGFGWQHFYFRWPSGRTAIQAMSIHDPRTCLASVGMVLENQLPNMRVEVSGIPIPFRVFLFRDRGRPVLVFHSIMAEERKNKDFDNDPQMGEYTLQGRWHNVKMGIRNRGQTVIEAAIWNTTDVPRALESLQSFLESSIRVESTVPQS